MAGMPLRHVLLALTGAIIWGVNFIAIELSLATYPPFLLAALRFTLTAIPTVLFIPRPHVQWRWVIGYGIGFGVMQFGFLYWGMAAGMPAGIASLVLQASAPFTVLLGAILLKEGLTPLRVVGIGIAIAGLSLVGWQRAEHAALLPFLLTLAAAFGWAIGNLCSRRAHTTEPFRLMMWMTVIPPVPLLLLSLLVEGPTRISIALRVALTPASMVPTIGLLYTVLIALVAGSGIWTWLMSRHPASLVAPFSLLVPVFGMTSAWLLLGEGVRTGELVGAALIVGGVLIGTARWGRQRAAPVGVPMTRHLTSEPRPVL